MSNVTIDATSNSGYQAAVSSFSWSHTCAAGAKLIVGLMADPTGLSSITVTYNGVSLSSQGAITNGALINLWTIDTPDSGSHNIEVTFSPTPAVGCAAAAISVLNAAAIYDLEYAVGSGPSDLTRTISDHFGDGLLLVVFGTNDTAVSLASPATGTANVTGAAGSLVMGYKAAAGTSDSLTLTGLDSGKDACGIAISYPSTLLSAFGAARSAAREGFSVGALVNKFGRSDEQTNDLARPANKAIAVASNYSTVFSGVVNTFVVEASGRSRSSAESNMSGVILSSSRGYDVSVSESSGHITSPTAALRVRDQAINFSGGIGDIIVSGSLAGIARSTSVTSSGGVGSVMTPLNARGRDRIAIFSTASPPVSYAGRSGLSESRSRSVGKPKSIAATNGSERSYVRSSSRAASRVPIAAYDRRTTTSKVGPGHSVAVASGGRSFSARRTGSTRMVLAAAIGLAEATHWESGKYRVFVGTPAKSIAYDRARLAPPVVTASMGGRSGVEAMDRQTMLSACFVVGASLSAQRDSARVSGVLDLTATNAITPVRSSAGTLAGLAAYGRPIVVARDQARHLATLLTVGESVAVARSTVTPPLSFAAIVVRDRIAVESSGRITGTAEIFARDAVTAACTLLDVSALPFTIAAEADVVIN